MRWFILVAIATVAIVTVACSGNNGDDAVLLLKDGNITQEDYRTRVRAMLLEAGAQDFCSGLQGLSDQEIIDVLKTEPEEESGLVGERGFTPVAGQEADSDDNIKAASIVSEECERVAAAPSPTTAPQSLQTSPQTSDDLETSDRSVELAERAAYFLVVSGLLDESARLRSDFVRARGTDLEVDYSGTELLITQDTTEGKQVLEEWKKYVERIRSVNPPSIYADIQDLWVLSEDKTTASWELQLQKMETGDIGLLDSALERMYESNDLFDQFSLAMDEALDELKRDTAANESALE